MLRATIAAGLLALSTAASAQPYRPEFNPSRLKGPHGGPPNVVAVLGSPHLSQLPPAFTADQVGQLVNALARFRPQMIGVEDRSGVQCDLLRRFPSRYADAAKNYCPDLASARAATGLDTPAATAEADRLLANWPVAPSPAQRRHLAAVFMAGGEEPSAEVQWLRLAPAERHSGDGLDAALVSRLERLRAARNETYAVAAPLAACSGLDRLYAIDDQSAWTPDPADPVEVKAQGAAIQKAWDNPATAQRKRTDDAFNAHLGQPGALLAYYRTLNAPDQAALVFRSDMGAALEEPSPQRFGRGYLAYWEARNLRMAANIRLALGEHPGSRMLVIVGASHKGYLDAYLDQMHDVRLLDVEPLLRQGLGRAAAPRGTP